MNIETIIKDFEGLEIKAYKDSAGIYTIGYGSTFNHDMNRPVQAGDTISEETALSWLRKDISKNKTKIKRLVKVPINENQLDSITSLAYNIGVGAFEKSTLLRLLNKGENKNIVAEQFTRWNKIKLPNGLYKEILGLTKRRELEKKLFLS